MITTQTWEYQFRYKHESLFEFDAQNLSQKAGHNDTGLQFHAGEVEEGGSLGLEGEARLIVESQASES